MNMNQVIEFYEVFAGSSIQAREFSDKRRKKLAKSGAAMPGGGFPIVNKEDLGNARQAIGRAKNPTAARAHIRERAKALHVKLSDNWKAAGNPYEQSLIKPSKGLKPHLPKMTMPGVKPPEMRLEKEAPKKKKGMKSMYNPTTTKTDMGESTALGLE